MNRRFLDLSIGALVAFSLLGFAAAIREAETGRSRTPAPGLPPEDRCRHCGGTGLERRDTSLIGRLDAMWG